jgi:hypothetical protein
VNPPSKLKRDDNYRVTRSHCSGATSRRKSETRSQKGQCFRMSWNFFRSKGQCMLRMKPRNSIVPTFWRRMHRKYTSTLHRKDKNLVYSPSLINPYTYTISTIRMRLRQHQWRSPWRNEQNASRFYLYHTSGRHAPVRNSNVYNFSSVRLLPQGMTWMHFTSV